MADTSTARILLVDDSIANLKILLAALETDGYELAIAEDGDAALRAATSSPPDLILLDVAMPGMNGFEVCQALQGNSETADIPVIFITAHDETDALVEGFRVGGVDFIGKPFSAEEVRTRTRTHLRISQLTRALRQSNEELQSQIERRQAAEQAKADADERLDILADEAKSRWGIDGFVGQSPTIQQILTDVRQLQSANTAVLVEGESGTGKELIARAIHFGGRRKQGPFIALNCSAIPGELAESTLFGHVRGAFSGAHASRKGSFQLADGGTLFLDEIADLPLLLQAKLLRVLEDGVVTPVGSETDHTVDVRVVAATNADLHGRIADEAFREDLFFRLAGFRVSLPPLRERRDDIEPLAQHFLDLLAREMGMTEATIADDALAAFASYHFPGNVRELKNMIEHALIRSGGAPVQAHHLSFIDVPATPVAAVPSEVASADRHEPSRRTAQEKESAVLHYLSQHDSINNEQCRALLDASYNQVSYLLRQMTAAGLLVRMGQRRGTFYRLP